MVGESIGSYSQMIVVKNNLLDNQVVIKKFNKVLVFLSIYFYISIVIRDKDMRNMREYYLQNFPTDELGIEINENATFEGLFRVLDNYEDVYEYIGVGDSVIRERVFSRLSEIMGVTYDEVYSQWLMAP